MTMLNTQVMIGNITEAIVDSLTRLLNAPNKYSVLCIKILFNVIFLVLITLNIYILINLFYSFCLIAKGQMLFGYFLDRSPSEIDPELWLVNRLYAGFGYHKIL